MTRENINEYKYLDLYWERPNRFPYFIKVDGKIAGFVLVNSHVLVQVGGKNVAEFYVLKKFRKGGVGKIAAKKSFAMFPGKWEVRQIVENPIAHIFWNKTISEYTDNNFEEVTMDDENWRGWVQTFDKFK